jgi:hypothetical protein
MGSPVQLYSFQVLHHGEKLKERHIHACARAAREASDESQLNFGNAPEVFGRVVVLGMASSSEELSAVYPFEQV